MAWLAGTAAAGLPQRLALEEARVEGARLDLGALREGPPVELGVEGLALSGLRPDQAGRLEATLRLANGDRVRLEGTVGPWAPGRAPAPEAPPPPLPFDLSLLVRGGDARSVVPLLPPETEVESARGTVDVTGRLARPAGSPDVELSLEMALDLEHLRIAGYEAGSTQGVLRWEEGTLVFASPVLDAYGGTWRPRGTLTPGDPPRIDLHLEVEDTHLQRLAARAGEGRSGPDEGPTEPEEGADPTGSPEPEKDPEPTLVDASLELRGDWHGGPDWLRGLEGGGRLEARGGALPRPGIVRAVANALIATVPTASGEPIAQGARGTTGLREATAHLEVVAGGVRTEDLVVRTEDYTLELSGRLEENGALDLRGTVLFTPQGMTRVSDLLGVPPGLRQAVRLPRIPVRVAGTLGDPQVQADAAGLPRMLVATILGIPGRIFDAVNGVGQAVKKVVPLPTPEPQGEAPSEPEPSPPSGPTPEETPAPAPG